MSERTCTVEGCGNPHEARGWCNKHYTRWRKYGDADKVVDPASVRWQDTTPAEQRFWAKVDKDGRVAPAHSYLGPCWNRTGTLNTSGYGVFFVDGKNRQAHRWVYESFVGPIPDGFEPDHLCRNRSCVNTAHLEVVTKAENILRGDGLPARNARKTHCDHGHEFTAENTRILASGHRDCITCRRRINRDAARRYRAKKG